MLNCSTGLPVGCADTPANPQTFQTHTQTQTRQHKHKHKHTQIRTQTHIHIHILKPTNTHTHTNTTTNTHTHTHKHAKTQNTSTQEEQTHKHRIAQTDNTNTPTPTQTHKHKHPNPPRRKTHNHSSTNTQTRKHTNTQTQAQTSTQRPKHINTNTSTQPQTQAPERDPESHPHPQPQPCTSGQMLARSPGQTHVSTRMSLRTFRSSSLTVDGRNPEIARTTKTLVSDDFPANANEVSCFVHGFLSRRDFRISQPSTEACLFSAGNHGNQKAVHSQHPGLGHSPPIAARPGLACQEPVAELRVSALGGAISSAIFVAERMERDQLGPCLRWVRGTGGGSSCRPC